MSSVVRGKSFDATAAVTTTIADTIDQVTDCRSHSCRKLHFRESSSSQDITYTATIHKGDGTSNNTIAAYGSDTVVTLQFDDRGSDDATLTIVDGASSASFTRSIAANDDVYTEIASTNAKINSANGGGFENLTFDANCSCN